MWRNDVGIKRRYYVSRTITLNSKPWSAVVSDVHLFIYLWWRDCADVRSKAAVWTVDVVVWPTMSCFADWSKRRHVTFVIIECLTCRRSTVQAFNIGTRHQLNKTLPQTLTLRNGTLLQFSTAVKNLGVLIDSQLTMADHIAAICRSGFFFSCDNSGWSDSRWRRLQ